MLSAMAADEATGVASTFAEMPLAVDRGLKRGASVGHASFGNPDDAASVAGVGKVGL